MNLVQIQERLKDLPTQAIMGYANGQNPQVPPYLALGELNRRKQMEQKAAQPPQGTVKDSLEQQVGAMEMQKMRPPQMPPQAPQMPPQGAPAQPDAQMAMAAGGLARLPIREMNFGSGGIIAFAEGGASSNREDPASIPFDPATATRRADFAPAPQETTSARRFLEAQMGNQDRSGIPEEFVPSKQTPIGQEYLNYLAERQSSSKEDERKFKEKEAARAKRDFFQSLIEAGEATRGQKGIGALFGGYGRSSGKFANEADERQSAFEKLRQERSDTDAKLKYEIDNLRRAEARGDAKTVYESKVKIAELTQAKDQMRLTAGQKLAGLESSEGINALDIASREKIAKLDRESRAAISRMPGAEQQLIEKAIASYREKNPTASFYDAYQAIKTIPANAKATMTRDQALDNVRKNLENLQIGPKLMKQASESLKASGNPNPSISQITEYLAQLEMNPNSCAPSASSGKVVDFNSLPK